MTKSGVSKQTTGGVKKPKKNFHGILRKWIRRRNCVICMIVSAVLVLMAFAGIATITYHYISDLKSLREKDVEMRHLEGRNNFDAYYSSGECYFDRKNMIFDQTYCNRYCSDNDYMEFMFQMKRIDRDNIITQKCPNFVQIRQCQEDKAEGSCRSKEVGGEHYIMEVIDGPGNTSGICVSCPST